jgi:hypothetical protein
MISFKNIHFKKNSFKNNNFKNKILKNSNYKKMKILGIILIFASMYFVNTSAISNASVSQTILGIGKGGTNANTVENAQTNLGRTDTVDCTNTDSQFPSSKAVYDYINNALDGKKYVAITIGGKIATSTDGSYWRCGPDIPNDTGDTILWQTVSYGNSMFLAAGANGTENTSTASYISTSKDGIIWTSALKMTTPKGVFTSQFAFGNFIMAGMGGYIMTSPDGLTFTKQSITNQVWRTSVLVAEKMLLGSIYLNQISYTTDGSSWSSPLATCDTPNSIRRLTFGNGIYISQGDGIGFTTSTDLINWSSCPYDTQYNFSQKVFGNVNGENKFLAIHNETGVVYTSSNGIDWQPGATISGLAGSGSTYIYYENNKFLVFKNNKFTYSNDGVNWATLTALSGFTQPYAIAYG